MLFLSLQAKYGNKWKKIAAEVPGRTAKRLGKWWEAYKDKQQKEKEKDRPRFAASGSTGETSNYSEMLATLADKFGQQQQQQGSTMLPHPTFPTASLLAPPPIVPLALLGPSMAGGTANPTSVGILIPKLPSFEMLPSHPLVTVAFPVPVMTTAIGSWLSTAITVPQCASLSTATAESAVEIIPVRVSSSRASEGHPATIVPASKGPNTPELKISCYVSKFITGEVHSVCLAVILPFTCLFQSIHVSNHKAWFANQWEVVVNA